jgi:hypothetical protein
MKKRLMLLVASVLAVQLIGASSIFAEYQAENDITLSVTVAEGTLQTSDSTGQETFSIQEGAHEELKETTGQEVDHSYIWIEVNGHKIFAIDPPKPMV